MRILISVIVLSSLMISCKTTINKNDIYGAWRSIPDLKWDSGGISDSVIFTKSSEIKTYILENKSIVDSTFYKFYVDADNKKLMMEIQGVKVQLEIIELSKISLIMRQAGKTAVIKYKKLE